MQQLKPGQLKEKFHQRWILCQANLFGLMRREKYIYINSLLDEESISNIIKLEELLDDQTNRDINGMVYYQ
jgi:hypothetical protein